MLGKLAQCCALLASVRVDCVDSRSARAAWRLEVIGTGPQYGGNIDTPAEHSLRERASCAGHDPGAIRRLHSHACSADTDHSLGAVARPKPDLIPQSRITCDRLTNRALLGPVEQYRGTSTPRCCSRLRAALRA